MESLMAVTSNAPDSGVSWFYKIVALCVKNPGIIPGSVSCGFTSGSGHGTRWMVWLTRLLLRTLHLPAASLSSRASWPLRDYSPSYAVMLTASSLQSLSLSSAASNLWWSRVCPVFTPWAITGDLGASALALLPFTFCLEATLVSSCSDSYSGAPMKLALLLTWFRNHSSEYPMLLV